MAEVCVVCGEADEGKPLYKKLGSGEHNVEVMAALRTLQLVTLPDSAKTTRYICWDCDEVVVNEYGRYLEEHQHMKKPPKSKPKQRNPKRKNKERKTRIPREVKSGGEIESSYRWVVQQVNPPPPSKHRKSKIKSQPIVPGGKRGNGGVGTSSLDQYSHHATHCLMCDNNFDEHDANSSGHRGYFQRHSLKRMVNDDMDVAQVMEVLGLARRIQPRMKARRFICNPCYIIIRRNYKDKLLKGSSIEDSTAATTATQLSTPRRNPLRRATTEEHAAEIARLLPPDLVECYKILTKPPSTRYSNTYNENYPNAGDTWTQAPSGLTNTPNDGCYGGDIQRPNVLGDNKWDTSLFIPPISSSPKTQNKLSPGKRKLSLGRNLNSSASPEKSQRKISTWGRKDKQASLDTDGNISPEIESEVEEDNMSFSQDEQGNYVIEVKNLDDTWNASAKQNVVMKDKMKKRNVLLPRRSHQHLNNCSLGQMNSSPLAVHIGQGDGSGSTKSEGIQEKENTQQTPSTSTDTSNGNESSTNGTCNICGINFAGKTPDWWYTLTSRLVGFDSITVNMALKVLETQLAHTSEAVRTAQQVCQPCYSMVSTGFKSQVVQRFAKQKNLKASQVDLSRVKIRMFPSEKNIADVLKEHVPVTKGEHLKPWKRPQKKKRKKQKAHFDMYSNDFHENVDLDDRKAQRLDQLHHAQSEVRKQMKWGLTKDYLDRSQHQEALPSSRIKKQRVSDDFVYDDWRSDDDNEQETNNDFPKRGKRKREDKVYIQKWKKNRHDASAVNDGLSLENADSDSLPPQGHGNVCRLSYRRPYQRTVSLQQQGRKHGIKNRLQDRIRNKNIHRYQTVRTLGAKSSVAQEINPPKRKRGRPRKIRIEPLIKRPRGRPSKKWLLKEAELLKAATLARSMQAQNKIPLNGEELDSVTKMQHMQVQYSAFVKQAQQDVLNPHANDTMQPQDTVIAANHDENMEVAALQSLQQRKNIPGDDGNAADIQETPVTKTQQHQQKCPSAKAIVLLKDLKFLLPQEAFGGKAVSAHKIEDDITLSQPQQFDQVDQSNNRGQDTDTADDYRTICDPIANQGDECSPLQSVFNSLSMYDLLQAGVKEEAVQHSYPKTSGIEKSKPENVCSYCVICGCSYMMKQRWWHHIDENIKPPSLLVSLQWVCVSLSVQPTHLPHHEKEKGKVCNQCFQTLVKRFAEFVQAKVGESCGLPAHEVNLDDYLITFNSETYNLEADPLERSYMQEVEEAEQLLKQHILPLLQQFSIDQMVTTIVQGTCTSRQPVMEQQFNLWLLLVLNELRVQIGADLTQLINWIEYLMPSDKYDRGLRPCSKELAGFLRRVSSSPFSHELSDPIPEIVFTLKSLPSVFKDKDDVDSQVVSKTRGKDILKVTRLPGTTPGVPLNKGEDTTTPNISTCEVNNIDGPISGVMGRGDIPLSALDDRSASSLMESVNSKKNRRSLSLTQSQISTDGGPKNDFALDLIDKNFVSEKPFNSVSKTNGSLAPKHCVENASRSPISTMDLIDPLEESLQTHQEDTDDDDLPWEKYLNYINLDDLINGKANPIPAHCMTQGLMYAIWQVSRLLAEGDQLVVDWVKQLSPVALNDSQVQSIVNAIGSLQSHFESHPNDVSSLEYEVIPLLGCSNLSSDYQGSEVMSDTKDLDEMKNSDNSHSEHLNNTQDSDNNGTKDLNSTQCSNPQFDTRRSVQRGLKYKLPNETHRRRKRRKRKRSESQQSRTCMKLRKKDKNVSYVFESSEHTGNSDINESLSRSVQNIDVNKNDRKLRMIETNVLYVAESSLSTLVSPDDDDDLCSNTTLPTKQLIDIQKSESVQTDENSESEQVIDDENNRSNSTTSNAGDRKETTDGSGSDSLETTSTENQNKEKDDIKIDAQSINVNENDIVQTTDVSNENMQKTDINRNDSLKTGEITNITKQADGNNGKTEQASTAKESDLVDALDKNKSHNLQASTANESDLVDALDKNKTSLNLQASTANESDLVDALNKNKSHNLQASTANESDLVDALDKNKSLNLQASTANESDLVDALDKNKSLNLQASTANESDLVDALNKNKSHNLQASTANESDLVDALDKNKSHNLQASTANESELVDALDKNKSHNLQVTDVNSVNVQTTSAEKDESVQREIKNMQAPDVSNSTSVETSNVQTTAPNKSDRQQITGVCNSPNVTIEINSANNSIEEVQNTTEGSSHKEGTEMSNPGDSSLIPPEILLEKLYHEVGESNLEDFKNVGPEERKAEVSEIRSKVLETNKGLPKKIEPGPIESTPELLVTTRPKEVKSLDPESHDEDSEPTRPIILPEKMQPETTETRPEDLKTRTEISTEKIVSIVPELKAEVSEPLRTETPVPHENPSLEDFGETAENSDSTNMVESESVHSQSQVESTENESNMNIYKKDSKSCYKEIKMSECEIEVTENVNKNTVSNSSVSESKVELKEKEANICENKPENYSNQTENVKKIATNENVEKMAESTTSVMECKVKLTEDEVKFAASDSSVIESKVKMVESDSHVTHKHSCKTNLTSSRHKQHTQENMRSKHRKTIEKDDTEEKLGDKRIENRSECEPGKTVKPKLNTTEPSLHHSKPCTSDSTSCRNKNEKETHPSLLGSKKQGTSSDSLQKSIRPVERKLKLSFEEFMNYDIKKKAPK
ncbi:hypothetical protein Pcinc_038682 [Petrolisthes cinctipes]|uniref:Uncharacterized protein n=1 Tax=Petrolisthes cinctipes TaxID=88211 RepID=A0AAE1BT66_PETCI|nr:hypothetical protein Pcinc_038682 [Petrolisthes cinctipes]